MEHYYSKKSSIRDHAVVYEALDRGHQSDVTRISKRPDRGVNASGRRMFTFMGSAGKPRAGHALTVARSRTPSKAATPRVPQRTPRSKRLPRSRSQSAIKAKPTPTKEQPSSAGKEHPSRSSSLAKKHQSRSASLNSSRRETVPIPAPVAVAPPKSKTITPIQIEIPTPAQPNETISPAILVGDEQKIDTNQPASPMNSSASTSSDEDNKVEEEIPSSPSVVGYRKVVYNENDDKWVEYWKIEEDIKRAQKKAKAQQLLNKWQAAKAVPKVHPIKGRITAKIQVMFPTAIVKQDRRHGGAHQSILMTDPLRIELYKRRAPIVPTYYQNHIVKYGKLPFRNNPRPHPIV